MVIAKYTYWLTEEGLLLIEGWARDGLTDKQIAHNVGISESTLNAWKNRFSEFSKSLKKGKEVVDRHVENALLKKALGFTYTERTAKMVDRDPEVVATERREYENRYKLDNPEASSQEIKDAAIKAIPTRERIILMEIDKTALPDTTAQIFWLKNRKPDVWRDRQVTSHEGELTVNGNNPFAGLSTEELRKMIDDG